MIPYRLKRFLLSPTELHVLCALLALTACLPALFPELCPEDAETMLRRYAGFTLMGSVITSTVIMLIAGAVHIIRLNNIKALAQLLKWALVWALTIGLFVLLSITANVPPPPEEGDAHPIQTTDTLSSPHDKLTGPESLTIPIHTQDVRTDIVEALPNLAGLEENHEAILRLYLERSPRWQGMQSDDTFFSKPGHLVMIPPTASGTPGLVHVCFRRLTEGAPLPTGYAVLRPGDSFPGEESRATDFAIDLGRNHYLLLAWRGTAHAETMHRALNAAIIAIDNRMQTLAESPTEETVERMLRGRISYTGSTPEIRLSEPPGQEGSYQAEIYANPGEEGTLLLYCRELESGRTLRLLSCPARHSEQSEELFRHNIPEDVPEWVRSTHGRDDDVSLRKDAPVFILGTGSDHRYFGVAIEVWFKPADSHRSRRLLLRRCYRMQMLDAAARNESRAEAATKQTEPEADKEGYAPAGELREKEESPSPALPGQENTPQE